MNINHTLKKNNKGFSLVELIIVIAIMSILAAVFGLALIRYIDKSKKAVDIETAQEIFKITGGKIRSSVPLTEQGISRKQNAFIFEIIAHTAGSMSRGFDHTEIYPRVGYKFSVMHKPVQLNAYVRRAEITV